VRNVANLVPPYTPDGSHHATSAALEFAILSLGVKHVVVMGHGRCGGIRAVINSAGPLTHTDFIGSWMRGINDVARVVPREPGVSDAEHERQIERASIEHSLANLRTFPWLRMKENRQELSIHGAWFDIAMGELHVYEEDGARWSLVA
jgi:carbonic anhydrase